MKKLLLVGLSLSFIVGFTVLNDNRNYSQIRQVSYGIGDSNEGIFCSATKISENQLLTAAHCVPEKDGKDNTSYVFNVYDQNVKIVVGKAVVEKTNRDRDLALLTIKEGVKGPIAVIADSDPLQDDKVWAVGYPLGETENVTEGIFINLDCNKDIGCFYFHNAPTTFGNSGGSLWVYNGFSYKLIGVTNRITLQGYGTPYNNLGLAVPLTDLKHFLSTPSTKS